MDDSKIEVKLVASLQSENLYFDSEDAAVYGAMGCFEGKTPFEMWQEDASKLTPEQIEAKKEKICRETSGRGHGAVLDQSAFLFDIENLPRAATLQLCLPEYLAHVQQSLRRVSAERGYFLPETIRKDERTVALMDNAFALYEEMDGKVPGEDARFLLPLGTRTNIQTLGNARELQHLHSMSQREGIPRIVRQVIETMVKQAEEIAPHLFKDRGTNYEILSWFPSSQLFARRNVSLENFIDYDPRIKQQFKGFYIPDFINDVGIRSAVEGRDEAELANLKHVHFEFLLPMSLATFHQATRQRTWNQSTESVYHAAERRRFVTPPSILNSEYAGRYNAQTRNMIDNYHRLLAKSFSAEDAVLSLPHALQICDSIHINGWNAVHSIGKRTCKTAQWEIREIARSMASAIDHVFPALGKYCLPQGKLYGKCPERENCGYCGKREK